MPVLLADIVGLTDGLNFVMGFGILKCGLDDQRIGRWLQPDLICRFPPHIDHEIRLVRFITQST